MNRPPLTRFAWLSIAVALATIALKFSAYLITDSVGLLSDAIESIVNLIGGFVALAMLTIAARPADDEHAYGHGKAEYFSSGVEGSLILVASVSIGIAAVHRLITPQPLQQAGLGLAVSAVAMIANLGVALLLLRVGKAHNSISLEANARHLLADVWTSAGVLAGVGLVAWTTWNIFDPIVALIVAGNVLFTGVRIIRRSIAGLMDVALSAGDLEAVREVLRHYEQTGIQFHALRSRQAGAQKFVSLHVLVPGNWSVQQGHKLLDQIEADIRAALPEGILFTHLESLDDPASWEDQNLEREVSQRRE